MTEQAVLVYLPAQRTGRLALVEEPVAAAVAASGAGEYDGHEIGPDGAVLYLYGPDADRLLEVVAPVLRRGPLPAGSYAIKRYGPPGARAVRLDLTAR